MKIRKTTYMKLLKRTRIWLVIVFLVLSITWLATDMWFLFKQYKSNVDIDFVFINSHTNRILLRSLKTKPSEVYNENKNEFTKLSLEYYPGKLIRFLGDNGQPSQLPGHLKYLSKDAMIKHSFDSALSDRISLNRNIGDVRGELCRKKEWKYSRELPRASVIISFHNEALSALFRTIHSVVNHTPSRLLLEVLVIDDNSTFEANISVSDILEHLGKVNDIIGTQKIIYMRNKKREGLVRSRMRGASQAKGDVLIFLDSHCEVTQGWVEPLLDRIQQTRSNVVCPVIEVIDPVDFSYKRALLKDITQVGSFSWDLYFDWIELPEEERKKRNDTTQPLRSPTMAGGLFAIDRRYFYELGSYDNQMDIWGGENLEMSFRIWMCHGSLEIIPCSRVGHIFRKTNSPYTFPNGVSETLARNFKRVAEVWMDEYKELYYRRIPESKRNINVGDLTDRIELRKRLNCNSFKWYLENIAHDVMGADTTPPAHGEVRNVESGLCLDSLSERENSVPVKLYQCHGQRGNQFFVLTKRGEITFNDEMCLDYSSDNDFITLWRCHGMGGNQEWAYNVNTLQIKHVLTSLCMTGLNNRKVGVKSCLSTDHAQKWIFQFYNKTIW